MHSLGAVRDLVLFQRFRSCSLLFAGLDCCRPWGDSLVFQVVLVVQEVPRSLLYILQARQEEL